MKMGMAETVHENAADAVRDADLVVLCVPVGVCGVVAQAISGALENRVRLSRMWGRSRQLLSGT